ncbi:MAG: hypothetical protein LKM31_14205 [Sphingobium sp.]|nr:hypothetical protein [Sphingobium sp.]
MLTEAAVQGKKDTLGPQGERHRRPPHPMNRRSRQTAATGLAAQHERAAMRVRQGPEAAIGAIRWPAAMHRA